MCLHMFLRWHAHCYIRKKCCGNFSYNIRYKLQKTLANMSPCLRNSKISHDWSYCKLHYLICQLHKDFCFLPLDFHEVRQGKWGFNHVIFSIWKVIVLWFIWKHFAWILIKNNKWNIIDTHQNLSSTFWGKTHYT